MDLTFHRVLDVYTDFEAASISADSENPLKLEVFRGVPEHLGCTLDMIDRYIICMSTPLHLLGQYVIMKHNVLTNHSLVEYLMIICYDTNTVLLISSPTLLYLLVLRRKGVNYDWLFENLKKNLMYHFYLPWIRLAKKLAKK